MSRRVWVLLVGLAAGSALGATTTLLLGDRQPVPEPRVVEDVPFTLHYIDPEIGGDLRVERGWVCDVDTTTAHAYCSREVTP